MPKTSAKAPAKTTRKPAERRHDQLAWTVGGLGLAAFVFALAVTALDALRHQTPAELTVVETARRATPSAVLVEIEVANRGGEPAAAVHVVGQGLSDHQAAADLDYVAGHSERQATLAFARDPGPLVLRVEGWSKP